MRKTERTIVASAAAAMLLALPPQHAVAAAPGLKVIHSFCADVCADGRNPEDGLVLGTDGNIYGTTAYGGPGDLGTVFQLKKSKSGKWTYTQIYHFNCTDECPDGFHPIGNLVQDTAGNLYGATLMGGGNQSPGALFELSHVHNTWSLKATYPFVCDGSSCPQGRSPNGSLTYAGAAQGLPYDGVSPLYGANFTGGAGSFGGSGTVFTAVPQGDSFAVSMIYDFAFGPVEAPRGGLLLDDAGNMFGTTDRFSGLASVFEISKDGASGPYFATRLYSFQHGTGSAAAMRLVQDTTGALYGASMPTGGVLFKLVPDGNASQFTTLHTFCSKKDCKDGFGSAFGPQLAGNGSLIGTTVYGGANHDDFEQGGGGTLYRFSGSKLRTLYSFCAKANCADGAYPYGTVVQTADKHVIGVTRRGGANGDGGTVYELTP